MIEPIEDRYTKTDKAVHVEGEEKKDPDVEMMVRRRWRKEVNKRVDQARVFRTMEWLTEVELEDIRRNILAPRDGEENINDIPMIEERIQNENGLMEPNETEILVCVETKITGEERLIIDELKALMITNET